jgi:hypothetical protein
MHRNPKHVVTRRSHRALPFIVFFSASALLCPYTASLNGRSGCREKIASTGSPKYALKSSASVSDGL